MAIHHIHVNPISACPFRRSDLLPQAREVGSKN